MKHDPITPPPSAGANGPRWTNRKMVEFLRALAATHSVTDAARAVGMSRQSAYKLRSRLKGKAFEIAWDQAFTQSYCKLTYAALDRALNGIEVKHYYKGELIDTSRRYDERLTVAVLKLISGPNGLAVGLPPAWPRNEASSSKRCLRRLKAKAAMRSTLPRKRRSTRFPPPIPPLCHPSPMHN